MPGLVPVDEAERLIGLLDGLSLRMVLQPAWAAPEQGQATLRRHLASCSAPDFLTFAQSLRERWPKYPNC
ncbi:TetR family transcriptional regulator C-terminal domain-containing protein [Arthrobacter alpinus]|nr:TetR family transcriptional regulator C-terminal domain-containing protein [Arthrobacter alpinus]